MFQLDLWAKLLGLLNDPLDFLMVDIHLSIGQLNIIINDLLFRQRKVARAVINNQGLFHTKVCGGNYLDIISVNGQLKGFDVKLEKVFHDV